MIFAKIFLDPMTESVESVIDRYHQHRQEFEIQRDGADARLLGRRGGPIERGYPEAPQPDAEPEAPQGAVAQAGAQKAEAAQ